MFDEVYIKNIVDKQRSFFRTGQTLDIDFRIDQLYKLKKAILKYENEIKDALYEDLNRSKTESYILDIATVIYEIDETIEGIRKWAKPELHFSGLICFPSLFTKVYKKPYGVTLIISPFNFPFLLSLGVLIPAIAGGNTACLKLSSKSSQSTDLICKLISNTFDEEYVCAIPGGHDVADICLEQRFDKIFYTGSPNVGKHVMAKASENLTPVALELGGETGNWCIIRKDANLKDAAKKIAFFKICNAGQICININQVAIAKEVADEFVELLINEIKRQIGENQSENSEYCKMINEKAYKQCVELVERYQDKVIYGGFGDKNTSKFSTTILYPIDINDQIVNKELFNPLLPIVPFNDNEIDKLIDVIENREHGLALYLFTKDIRWANRVMEECQFGGGCINEVTMHMLVKGAPFNGTGHSGMGAYHGKWGFNEFTHPCTVLRGSNHFNLSLREHPYSDLKEKLFKFIIYSPSSRFAAFLKDLIEMIIITFISIILILNFLFMPCQIVGKSMYPLLMDNDRAFSYIFDKDVNRFDICIIKTNVDDKKIIKRLIGMPNETIEYIDNKLYVNNNYVEENFVKNTDTEDFKIVLKDNEYFFLGDNRATSKDSRYYGPFSYEDIVASNIFVIYPLSRFGVKK